MDFTLAIFKCSGFTLQKVRHDFIIELHLIFSSVRRWSWGQGQTQNLTEFLEVDAVMLVNPLLSE